MKKLEIKKFNKAGELSWALAIIIVAFGVCLNKKADLGMSVIAAPTFIIYEAVKSLSWLSVGMAEYLVQGVILIIMCIVVRRFNWRYLLTFLCAVIYGYTMDLWLLILGPEPFTSIYMRWGMLLLSDVIISFGVAFYFRTYLPLQVHELFVSEVCERYKLKVSRVKLIYDLSFLAICLVLAFSLFGDVKEFDWSKIYMTSFHSIGPGSIVAAFLNAPLINIFGKLQDKIFGYEPLFKKFYKVLAINKKEEECQNSELSAKE